MVWNSAAPKTKEHLEGFVTMRIASSGAKSSFKFRAILAAICIACILGLVAVSLYSQGLWRQILGVVCGYALVICFFAIIVISLEKSNFDDLKKK